VWRAAVGVETWRSGGLEGSLPEFVDGGSLRAYGRGDVEAQRSGGQETLQVVGGVARLPAGMQTRRYVEAAVRSGGKR
jgi:hypothetical protein